MRVKENIADYGAHRVPGFLTSGPNGVLPPPSPATECCSFPLGPKGETYSLAGEWLGGPNYDEAIDTLVTGTLGIL
jgi:hypothetical protein